MDLLCTTQGSAGDREAAVASLLLLLLRYDGRRHCCRCCYAGEGSPLCTTHPHPLHVIHLLHHYTHFCRLPDRDTRALPDPTDLRRGKEGGVDPHLGEEEGVPIEAEGPTGEEECDSPVPTFQKIPPSFHFRRVSIFFCHIIIASCASSALHRHSVAARFQNLHPLVVAGSRRFPF